jgi:Ca2+-binding RTX toxin-like protein
MSNCSVVGIAITVLLLAGCGSSPPDRTPKAQPETPLCLGVRATIVGSAKDDVLTGTEQADVIWTGAGDDRVDALAGDDLLCLGEATDGVPPPREGGGDSAHGGEGNDRLVGGPGDNWLTGDEGDDELWAAPDPSLGDYPEKLREGNQLTGGPGRDVLHGRAGQDVLHGGGGADVLDGLGGDDLLIGDSGDDVLNGGDGKDRLQGQDGDDRIDGGPGNDVLIGDYLLRWAIRRDGDGNDVLTGGAGNDKVFGWPGQNKVDAGPGVDTCVVTDIQAGAIGCERQRPVPPPPPVDRGS